MNSLITSYGKIWVQIPLTNYYFAQTDVSINFMKAYLDNNIFIGIEEGEIDLSSMINIIDKNIDQLYYSAAHICEADAILGKNEEERNKRIEKRLNTIENVTHSNYLYEDLENNVFFQKEKPSIVLETIREVPIAAKSIRMLSNLIKEDQKTLVRDTLGIETYKLNNYKPKEVIDQLNKSLSKNGEGYSLIGMLEASKSYHSQKSTFGLSNNIAGLLEIIDILGYWKDVATENSNYARAWDSSHVFFAAFCEYFITNDKRLRNKANVVYEIYNIGTKILSSDGKE